ncbi:MAG: DUF1080 domain-containing protein [Acidobacteriota bacterium]
MKPFTAALLMCSALLPPGAAQSRQSSLAGRWGFNLTTAKGEKQASWLGITEKNGMLDIWYQPTGGNVRQVRDFKAEGAHLSLTVSEASGDRPAVTWDLNAGDDKLTGVQKRGDATSPLAGFREPELKRNPPKSWGSPEPLFDGKDLAGWEPMGANSHWVVKDGLLVNEAHGANLQSKRSFEDFRLHFEANCPDEANSGFYLRGRYEVQLEYEPLSKNPPERRIGSIYGRIAPSVELPRKPGEWDTFDITLVGRTVTIVRNGVTTIDRKEIEGITGGALDASEGEPGPFYIQGDHTGGLKFRNITVAVPKQ